MHKKNISSGGNSNIIQIEKLLSPHQREIFLNQSRNFQEVRCLPRLRSLSSLGPILISSQMARRMPASTPRRNG
jgi:hypothetical protein